MHQLRSILAISKWKQHSLLHVWLVCECKMGTYENLALHRWRLKLHRSEFLAIGRWRLLRKRRFRLISGRWIVRRASNFASRWLWRATRWPNSCWFDANASASRAYDVHDQAGETVAERVEEREKSSSVNNTGAIVLFITIWIHANSRPIRKSLCVHRIVYMGDLVHCVIAWYNAVEASKANASSRYTQYTKTGSHVCTQQGWKK